MDVKTEIDVDAKLREGICIIANVIITFLFFYVGTENENTRDMISMNMYNALWRPKKTVF
jgi:hypothetical protein